METAIQNIYDRRAVRKYQDRMIDDELIDQVIDAGRMAPSAMNKQSWKFYVLTHKDTILSFSRAIVKTAAKELTKEAVRNPWKAVKTLLHFHHAPLVFKGEDLIFHGAPVVIFITAPGESEWAGLDTGMCAENMMLAAKSLGLDTCPVGLARYAGKTSRISKLGLSASESIQLAVILGYGAETPVAQPRVTGNVIFADRAECC